MYIVYLSIFSITTALTQGVGFLEAADPEAHGDESTIHLARRVLVLGVPGRLPLHASENAERRANYSGHQGEASGRRSLHDRYV